MLTKSKALHNLVLAALMSRGYVFGKKDLEFIVPFTHEKRFYLADYLKEHKLQDHVSIDTESYELSIKLTPGLSTLVKSWWVGQEKIFLKNFLKQADLQAIILCINLFGNRQVEGVAFLTNVKQNYLFTMCYTLTNILGVKTIFSKNQVKITNVTQLFLEVVDKTSSFDSSSIATYLNKKEKEELVKYISELQLKLGDDVYA